MYETLPQQIEMNFWFSLDLIVFHPIQTKMEEGQRAVAARRRGGAVRAEEVVLLPARPLHRAAGRQVHAPQRPHDCEFHNYAHFNHPEFSWYSQISLVKLNLI